MEVPGNVAIDLQPNKNCAENFLSKLTGDFMHPVLVDEEFSMIASHVGEAIKKKIVNSEYVDFAKLLPTEDFNVESDANDLDQMVMVNQDGQVYWVPENEATGRNNRNSRGPAITSIHRWEQAFRVFSHVYTEAFPNRATELMQYSFIIHDAAQTFPWDNVYGYDVIFRRHMSKFPTRNWGIFLQQAWSLKMRPNIAGTHHNQEGGTPP